MPPMALSMIARRMITGVIFVMDAVNGRCIGYDGNNANDTCRIKNPKDFPVGYWFFSHNVSGIFDLYLVLSVNLKYLNFFFD